MNAIISEIVYAIIIGLSTLFPTKEYQLYPNTSFIWQMKLHGTVVSCDYEGYEHDDDYYTIRLQDGTLVEVVSDDLIEGDNVTVYYNNGEVIHTLYGRR